MAGNEKLVIMVTHGTSMTVARLLRAAGVPDTGAAADFMGGSPLPQGESYSDF